jgi:hypothetical protein
MKLTHLSLVLALLLGCGSPRADADAAGSGPMPAPVDLESLMWTNAFLQPANLIADEVVIEGPPALRNHVRVRQDSQGTVYSAQTTSKGFLQELAAKPEAGYVELHAQLDSWQIVAFRRITWLERPGLGPVLVRASGGASWHAVAGGAERREEVLEFRGDLQR